MVAVPVRVDLRPDSPPPGALDPWRARLEALLSDAAPPWMDLERARVPTDALDAVPVGPALVLGFGGSALGARTALGLAGRDQVRVLDSLDLAVVGDCFAWAKAEKASLIVVSKSGRTIEVSTLLRALAGSELGPRFFVSDPKADSGSNEMATLIGDHVRFEMPADVGGRYSVFTAVGQVPLRAAGLDPHVLIRGAEREIATLGASPDHVLAPLWWRSSHPAAASVIWSYDERLGQWAAWLQQLECESLGRARASADPVGELVVPLRGPADQHSVAQLLLDGPADKRVVVLDFESDFESERVGPSLREVSNLRQAARDATFDALSLPSARMLVRDRTLETLGALMLDAMVGTVLLAEHLEVDPYGQPAVERIKKRVAARMSATRGS